MKHNCNGKTLKTICIIDMCIFDIMIRLRHKILPAKKKKEIEVIFMMSDCMKNI